MPGFRAHYFFGDESEKAMETTPEFILNHRNVYNLGQQGPDIFFYSPQAHLFYKKNIGFVMHADRVMSFFQNLFLSNRGKTLSRSEISHFINLKFSFPITG